MEASRMVAIEERVKEIPAIQRWCSKLLTKHSVESSYCLIAGIVSEEGSIAPTLIIGYPDTKIIPKERPPFTIEYLYKEDEIQDVVGYRDWAAGVVEEREKVSLENVSLGIRDCISEAGSFGGYLRDSDGNLFGLTAAHCLPDALPGTEVVSPSTLELTGRLNLIVPYTNHSPEQLATRKWRQEEADGLLQRFERRSDPEGVQVVGAGGDIERVKLVGKKFGSVVATKFEDTAGLLQIHNEELLSHGATSFSEVDPAQKSRLDYAIFTIDIGRWELRLE